MAEPGRSFVIRDPVHGYLRVAAHERVIVDHPVTQRLRHISQLGLAQLVYPEANTSRFAHSIGTMHIASRFVVAAIENADLAVARAFFDDLHETFSPLKDGMLVLSEMNVLLEREASLSGTGLLSGRVMFRHRILREDPKFKQLLTLVEAAVRLAALFHDLGHLPFSHDLEFALQSHIGESQPEKLPAGLDTLAAGTPHEIVGHDLAKRVLFALIPEQETAKRAIYTLARNILDAHAPYGTYKKRATAVEWLHSIIDGEIDVDRADYLLRDARALGFEFAAYDLDRLVSNAILLDDSNFGFISGVDEHALTAAESFVVSRYRSSHALIRHHKVTQIAMALRYVSTEVFRRGLADDFLVDLAAVTQKASSGEAARDLLERFARYDDSFWFCAMRELKPSAEETLLDACLGLVTVRKKSLHSLWKRRGELTTDELQSINQFDDLKLTDLRRKLEPKGVLVAKHTFRPYRVSADGDPKRDSLALIKTKHGGVQPLATVSELVRSLMDAWEEEAHMHAFAVGEFTKADFFTELSSLGA